MSQVQVTISDEEYSEMLQVRLAAKHMYETGEATLEEYNQARAVVRRARKVRRTEGAVVENYKQQSATQHQAMTRKGQSLAGRQEPKDAPVTLIQVPERRVKVTPDPEPVVEAPVVVKAPARRSRKAKVA